MTATNVTLTDYRAARNFLACVMKGLPDVKLKLALANALDLVDSCHKQPMAQAWGPTTQGVDVRTARKTTSWAIALNVAGVGVSDACLSAMTPMPLPLYAALLSGGAAIGFALTPIQRRALWVKLGGVDDIEMPDMSDAEMSEIDFDALLTPPPAPSATLP